VVNESFEGYTLSEEIEVPQPLRAYTCSRGDLRGVLYLSAACDPSDFLAQLSHYRALDWHALVRVVDGGVDDRGRCWVVTERPGEPITVGEGRDALVGALDVAMELAAVLAEADERGLHHGDLGLDTLHRDAGGALKLSRFGYLRLFRTEPRLVACRPRHRAPEVLAKGHAVGGAADVYSAGAMLREVVQTCRPGGAALPAELIELIDTATAHAPEARFPSGAELFVALRDASMALLAWTPEEPAPSRDTLPSSIEIRSVQPAVKSPPRPSPSLPPSPPAQRATGHVGAMWMAATTALAMAAAAGLVMLNRPVVVVSSHGGTALTAAALAAAPPQVVTASSATATCAPESAASTASAAPAATPRRARAATRGTAEAKRSDAPPAGGSLCGANGNSWYHCSAPR
jgi:hypothetical protein